MYLDAYGFNRWVPAFRATAVRVGSSGAAGADEGGIIEARAMTRGSRRPVDG